MGGELSWKHRTTRPSFARTGRGFRIEGRAADHGRPGRLHLHRMTGQVLGVDRKTCTANHSEWRGDSDNCRFLFRKFSSPYFLDYQKLPNPRVATCSVPLQDSRGAGKQMIIPCEVLGSSGQGCPIQAKFGWGFCFGRSVNCPTLPKSGRMGHPPTNQETGNRVPLRTGLLI